jgi:hypothetical protein
LLKNPAPRAIVRASPLVFMGCRMEANLIVELIDKRPEILLFGLIFLVILLLIVVAIIAAAFSSRSRFSDYVPVLRSLLADSDVIKNIKDNPDAAERFVRKVLESAPQLPPSEKSRSFLSKVVDDITWDVAGLIGMIVTIVIVVMVISGKTVDIPKELLVGWFTILGYYFGRAQAKND